RVDRGLRNARGSLGAEVAPGSRSPDPLRADDARLPAEPAAECQDPGLRSLVPPHARPGAGAKPRHRPLPRRYAPGGAPPREARAQSTSVGGGARTAPPRRGSPGRAFFACAAGRRLQGPRPLGNPRADLLAPLAGARERGVLRHAPPHLPPPGRGAAGRPGGDPHPPPGPLAAGGDARHRGAAALSRGRPGRTARAPEPPSAAPRFDTRGREKGLKRPRSLL